MKNWILKAILASAVVLPLLGGSASAQDIDSCTNSTLMGDYAFRVSGYIFSPVGTIVQWRDGVAMTHFDGNGGLTQVDIVVGNGVVTPGPTDPTTGFHVNEIGTYTVNADCTGKAEIDFPTPPGGTSGAVIKLMFVLSNHGRTIHTIVSSLTPPNSSTPVPANIHSDGEKLRGNEADAGPKS